MQRHRPSAKNTRLVLMLGFLAALFSSGCATFGTSLRSSSSSTHIQVRVEKGDTLASLANHFDTDWRTIANDNHLGATRPLRVGQVLQIKPGPAGMPAMAGSDLQNIAGAQSGRKKSGGQRSAGLFGSSINAPAGDVSGDLDNENEVEPKWSEEDYDPASTDVGVKRNSRAKGSASDSPSMAPAGPAAGGKHGLLYGEGGANETGLFKWPVLGSISSTFGPRWGRFHKGIDIRARRGTPIRAAKDGRVIFAGRKKGYGTAVILDHGRQRSLYGHCGRVVVKEGDWVDTSEVIAYVGTSGNARGPHLHFEIRTTGDRPLNPEPLLEQRLVSQLDIKPIPQSLDVEWNTGS